MHLAEVDRGSGRDAVTETLTALNDRLEEIRREHLAKNRSCLRDLSNEQLQEVERLTAAITAKVFFEVAFELEHSAAAGKGREASKAVSLMLGLAG